MGKGGYRRKYRTRKIGSAGQLAGIVVWIVKIAGSLARFAAVVDVIVGGLGERGRT